MDLDDAFLVMLVRHPFNDDACTSGDGKLWVSSGGLVAKCLC